VSNKPLVLPPPKDPEERIDQDTVLGTFDSVAEAIQGISRAELKRVVLAVLALHGLTPEDL
jgi:hypothetical protein